MTHSKTGPLVVGSVKYDCDSGPRNTIMIEAENDRNKVVIAITMAPTKPVVLEH